VSTFSSRLKQSFQAEFLSKKKSGDGDGSHAADGDLLNITGGGVTTASMTIMSPFGAHIIILSSFVQYTPSLSVGLWLILMRNFRQTLYDAAAAAAVLRT